MACFRCRCSAPAAAGIGLAVGMLLGWCLGLAWYLVYLVRVRIVR